MGLLRGSYNKNNYGGLNTHTDRDKIKSSMMAGVGTKLNTQRGEHKDSMMGAETNFTSAMQAATNLDLQSGTFDT